jgi:hypothetical protein
LTLSTEEYLKVGTVVDASFESQDARQRRIAEETKAEREKQKKNAAA